MTHRPAGFCDSRFSVEITMAATQYLAVQPEGALIRMGKDMGVILV